jgi:adenosylcobinamide kinase/adenosylcobinamide-phosphate guanylyltransferase
MRILISGGCKNGKSYYAQRLAKAQSGTLYYVAAMQAVDDEDRERILRHKNEREGWGFETIEQPVNVEEILLKCDSGGSFLLDSVTALLANEMFKTDGSVNENAAKKIVNALSRILRVIRNIVIVSDNIYSDAMIYDIVTEKYRKSLAQIDRLLARDCDAVLEVAHTNLVVHKGGDMLGELYKTIF